MVERERRIMSELTPCNYCSLNNIKRRAEQDGMIVTTRLDSAGWTAVYVHPPRVNLPKNDSHDKPSPYRVALMMEITDHCVC